MKAILLEKPGQFNLLEQEEPEAPGPGYTLVRVRHVGICGTDLHAFRGEQPFFTYPRILGHELSVEVMATEQGDIALTGGALCAVEPYFNCGYCPACLRGKPNCCINLNVFGVHIDGGMREFAYIPTAKLHPSTTLASEQLALVEPLAIGAHAVSRAQLSSHERVLVVGAGPIGLAVTQCALLAGAQVIVMDMSEQRLAFCQGLWPQVICLHTQSNALALLQREVGDDLPPVVFDATGNSQSMHAAFSYVGYAGRLIFVGLFQGDISFHDPDFHRRELTVLSSRNATFKDFRFVIHALEKGHINIAPWITHRTTSDNVLESLPLWFGGRSDLLKGVIAF
ncbi:zinc-type alcohol dehydrogenase [Ktedonobacter sp. SOSP1-52]|uniref:zinc-binding alcohol dehydrogenase family protein n=1 Tax=Ktedonobacter sp. SOSP1-52 TaxID=2778366 RepID=UPI00191516AA|nr:zinc-binding alcohol dehydrogenase family protein [Ktedonobacter sp. SOSP1-52]GHO71224.1 zinc-type alcohol dehydrogenase [Ktedonobacter sp. SOSP1-52]